MRPSNIFVLFCLFQSALAFGKGGSNAPGARYQIIQISEYRKDQYLIDNQAGKLWVKTCVEFDSASQCTGLAYWAEELIEGKNISTERINRLIKKSVTQDLNDDPPKKIKTLPVRNDLN